MTFIKKPNNLVTGGEYGSKAYDFGGDGGGKGSQDSWKQIDERVTRGVKGVPLGRGQRTPMLQ